MVSWGTFRAKLLKDAFLLEKAVVFLKTAELSRICYAHICHCELQDVEGFKTILKEQLNCASDHRHRHETPDSDHQRLGRARVGGLQADVEPRRLRGSQAPSRTITKHLATRHCPLQQVNSFQSMI